MAKRRKDVLVPSGVLLRVGGATASWNQYRGSFQAFSAKLLRALGEINVTGSRGRGTWDIRENSTGSLGVLVREHLILSAFYPRPQIERKAGGVPAMVVGESLCEWLTEGRSCMANITVRGWIGVFQE